MRPGYPNDVCVWMGLGTPLERPGDGRALTESAPLHALHRPATPPPEPPSCRAHPERIAVALPPERRLDEDSIVRDLQRQGHRRVSELVALRARDPPPQAAVIAAPDDVACACDVYAQRPERDVLDHDGAVRPTPRHDVPAWVRPRQRAANRIERRLARDVARPLVGQRHVARSAHAVAPRGVNLGDDSSIGVERPRDVRRREPASGQHHRLDGVERPTKHRRPRISDSRESPRPGR